MYINSGLENSDIHKSLVNVTGLEPNLALSILKFVNLHGGCIAGSCALAMYLERNNMPSFRPGDIDIYIPSRTGRYSSEERQKEEPPDMPYPHKPFLDDAYRSWYSSKNFGKNPSHWNDIDKMFLTEFSQYYERVGYLYTNNRIKSYYLDTDHLPNMDNLKEDEKKEMFGLLWTTITKFKRKHPIFDDTNLHWSVQTGFQTPSRTTRYNGETYKRYDGQNYDYSKECNTRNIMFCSTPPGQQEIQLIFLKENVDVHQYISKNYDFSACKVYTSFSLQALKQEHKLVSLHEESIKNRILNIPNNWKYITFAACFKTVTRRFIKYTQRGFIPMHYKAFEAPLLKKQAIYDAMKKSSMKLNAGIVSDSVKMREESLKKLIEKDYNEEGMNGWRNFSQEKSSTPLADSYRKMTIMLKQYLYYKILQTYEENPKRRRFDSDSTISSGDESSSEDEERHRAALRRGARVRGISAVPENGYEHFDRDKADGIWVSLDEDISNLIADFKKFDMVKFWKSSPGKAILRQISNIPVRGERDAESDDVLTFSDEDLILSKLILTFFLEDIRNLLGRALWFLYDKTIKIRDPDRAGYYHIMVDVSKEHPSWLARDLEVFNDDGSIKNEFNQSEFLAEISEPAINRIYRNRAATPANEGVEESKSTDSFEEHGDVLLHADASALLREGILKDYEYSDRTARLRELSQRSASPAGDAYNKDPDDIHIRTLIGNIEDLQGLGTHNKETVVRKIRSNLRGGKKKKLRRIIRKNN